MAKCSPPLALVHPSIDSLSEEMEAHLFCFLATPDLAKFQATSTSTYKKTKAYVFLRRTHSMIREHSWFEHVKFKWKSDKERRVLTSIQHKMIGWTPEEELPTVVLQMDTNSLMDFNRSIDWLEQYDADCEFVDLLMTFDKNGNFWSPEERVYVDNWLREWANWFTPNTPLANPGWQWLLQMDPIPAQVAYKEWHNDRIKN
jgi:hypothetical protein